MSPIKRNCIVCTLEEQHDIGGYIKLSGLIFHQKHMWLIKIDFFLMKQRAHYYFYYYQIQEEKRK